MIPIINFDEKLPSDRPLVLGLGVFDGVHLGHRKIIAELCAMAERCHAVPAAVTFDPHPRAVLCPSDPPQMLLPLEERCRLLREAGAALTGVIPFSSEFGSVSAGKFLDFLMNSGKFRLAGICVGSRWRFGCRGAGNRELIEKFDALHPDVVLMDITYGIVRDVIIINIKKQLQILRLVTIHWEL